jgi:hypothetical protein
MQNQQVLRKILMRAPQKHDELRASRGILTSVALGLAFWLVIILCVVLLIRYFARTGVAAVPGGAQAARSSSYALVDLQRAPVPNRTTSTVWNRMDISNSRQLFLM